MIKNFKDKETERLFKTGISKKLPSHIIKTAIRKLDMLDAAYEIKDLEIPPGNRLERLKGNLKEYYSIRINDQYRIIFKFEQGNAYDVQIIDYHK
ncbi:plasmid maintenance system killer protein [Deferribacter desulfuricans SSM1]|uniref:Plasmid maintenance system killer protein n=1 Tax=Deferribacter desulfuricans (strain DSM 14783 / JCM 11476 / NBRC 101012 / SSM1) TaxID=639282 RepID=D3PC73_DEFDS|nr:type II toxin-antitoxin system RelE/ParE family toxin [Deferribacter desulfuricans]BAI80196.1 plasmid maintenance system killer protein [Deferribacter desulfuricans SSM1]